MIRIPAILIALCFSVLVHAQGYVTLDTAPRNLQKLYEDALAANEEKENEKALQKLDKALAAEPTFIDAWVKKAEIQFAEADRTGAIESLSAAVALDSAYDARSLYSLGRLLEFEDKYEEAIEAHSSYLKHGDLEPERVTEIEARIEKLRFKVELISDPVPFEPEPVPGTINTAADEVLATVTVDGSQMIFTRRQSRSDENLFVAQWDSTKGEWGKGMPLDEVNSAYNEGAQTISADGRVVAFTSCGRRQSYGGCDIYISVLRDDGSWTEPVNPADINSAAWDGQPTLSADGRVLYFSSSRPGGIGKRDLWMSRLTGNGQWSPPENLGDVINTKGNESSPFLHFDDKTLYFMSDGHPGMGDYDIFVSRLEDKVWLPPENIGYPINTERREGALSVHPAGDRAYFTREAEDNGTMDIWRFELPENMRPEPISYIDGFVFDDITKQPVAASIEVFALDQNDVTYNYMSSADGAFIATLAHDKAYGIHVTAPGYAFYSARFELGDQPYSRRKVAAPLVPISAVETDSAAPIVLNNVEFEFGSADLTQSSIPELSRLKDLLTDNPELMIEIRGHTDNVGNPESNLQLSEARALAVHDWLVAAGISASRLSSAGFGEELPIADNATPEGRQRNRRTEFVIR